MTIGDKLLLGLNTTLIGMGIVFLVLVALYYIIKLESSIFRKFASTEAASAASRPGSAQPARGIVSDDSLKKGVISGRAEVKGAESDEELAAIMASVSFDCDIPLSQLKIKSIKRIGE